MSSQKNRQVIFRSGLFFKQWKQWPGTYTHAEAQRIKKDLIKKNITALVWEAGATMAEIDQARRDDRSLLLVQRYNGD